MKRKQRLENNYLNLEKLLVNQFILVKIESSLVLFFKCIELFIVIYSNVVVVSHVGHFVAWLLSDNV